MHGLDTNVLVRYLTQDDPGQARAATHFIRQTCTADEPCFLNRVVLCELVWVLESAYRYSRPTVADVIERILQTAELDVEDRDVALAAVADYRSIGLDLADALLGRINHAVGCETTATFDRRAGSSRYFLLLDQTSDD